MKQLPAARDAFVLTLTGYDTFVADDSLLRGVIEKAYEIRVMLVNPVGKALRERADSLPPDITVLTLRTEIEATIGYLSGMRKYGKMVKLKFYDEEPFWKLIASACSPASHATGSSCPFTWCSSTSGMMRVIPSTISTRTSWSTATLRERKPGGPFWAFRSTPPPRRCLRLGHSAQPLTPVRHCCAAWHPSARP